MKNYLKAFDSTTFFCKNCKHWMCFANYCRWFIKISFVFKAFLLVVAPKHLPLPHFAILGGVFVWLKPFISTHFTRALLSSVHHSVSFIAIAFVRVFYSGNAIHWKMCSCPIGSSNSMNSFHFSSFLKLVAIRTRKVPKK